MFDTVAQNIKKLYKIQKKIESSATKTRRKSHPTTHSAIDHEKTPLAKVSQSTFNGKIILFAQRKERSFRFSKRKSEKNLISWGIWTTLHTATCQNCGCVKWLYALLFGNKIVVKIVTHCAFTIRVVQFRRRKKKLVAIRFHELSHHCDF